MLLVFFFPLAIFSCNMKWYVCSLTSVSLVRFAFQYNPSLQPRALVVFGCISKRVTHGQIKQIIRILSKASPLLSIDRVCVSPCPAFSAPSTTLLFTFMIWYMIKMSFWSSELKEKSTLNPLEYQSFITLVPILHAMLFICLPILMRRHLAFALVLPQESDAAVL